MPFDPIESKRKIKQLIGEQLNKAFEALRAEYKSDVLTLNAKFDTVKAGQDITTAWSKTLLVSSRNSSMLGSRSQHDFQPS